MTTCFNNRMAVFSPQQESSLVAFLYCFFGPIFLIFLVFIVATPQDNAPDKNDRGKGPQRKRKAIDAIEKKLLASAHNLDDDQPPATKKDTRKICWKHCNEFLGSCLLSYQAYCHSKNNEAGTGSIFCARWLQPKMATEYHGTPHAIFFGSISGEPYQASKNSQEMQD